MSLPGVHSDRSTRIQNNSEDEHCGWCCDDAFVFVGLNAGGHDQMAPCPACEKGFLAEFPGEGKKPPWGNKGFWQGRPWRDLGLTEKSCRCHEKPTIERDALARLEKLRESASADEAERPSLPPGPTEKSAAGEVIEL